MRPLVSSSTAAKRCGTSRRTFLRMVGTRIEPRARLGDKGAMLFDPADVERLRSELMAEAFARFDGEPTDEVAS